MRLFIEKLRPKNKTMKQQEQAARISLAHTVACIAFVLAFVFYVAGNNASGRPKSASMPKK